MPLNPVTPLNPAFPLNPCRSRGATPEKYDSSGTARLVPTMNTEYELFMGNNVEGVDQERLPPARKYAVEMRPPVGTCGFHWLSLAFDVPTKYSWLHFSPQDFNNSL